MKCNVLKISYLTWGLFAACIVFGFRIHTTTDSENNSFVIPKMMEQMKKNSKLSFYINNCERIGTELKCGKQQVFLQRSPFKCRVLMILPDKGDQIVYNEEKGKSATYIPVGFPYVNVALDPLGSKMKKNNHHSIYELGFDYYTKIINHYYGKYKSSFVIKKTETSGKIAYEVSSVLSDFKYVKYTVQKGETARTIAQKNYVSEYLILERNQENKSLNEGETIFIPNHYYKKIKIMVDGSNYTPTYIEVFDDEGLLEKYEFFELNTAPEFTEKTFKE